MKLSTKSQLLRGAEKLLIDQGVRAISVRKVGEATGLNPTLVTYHFGSVQNLLAQLAVENVDPMLGAWSLLGDRDFLERASLDDVLDCWLGAMMLPAAFHDNGRALTVIDEIAAHGEPEISEKVLKQMFGIAAMVTDALELHLTHMDRNEIIARLRFISGAALGPPPRSPNSKILPSHLVGIDNLHYLKRFARAALTH